MDELIEKLRKLEGELREGCWDQDADTCAKAAAALEAAREDAERYRWLRENCGLSGSGPHTGAQVIVYYADCGDGRHGIAYTGPKQRVGIMALDAAIDQARGKGGGEVGS